MLYAVGNQLKGTLLNTVSLLAGKPSLFILYSYSQVYLSSFRGNKSHHFPHKATECIVYTILPQPEKARFHNTCNFVTS